MLPVVSSNACYFEEGSQKLQDNTTALTSTLMPYESLLNRFKQVLEKGDLLLVHLMLKQAANSSNKKVMVQMINTLVQKAITHSSKRK